MGAVATALKTYRERLQYLTTAVDTNLFHRIRPVVGARRLLIVHIITDQ
jgi:hypothetical protein